MFFVVKTTFLIYQLCFVIADDNEKSIGQQNADIFCSDNLKIDAIEKIEENYLVLVKDQAWKVKQLEDIAQTMPDKASELDAVLFNKFGNGNQRTFCYELNNTVQQYRIEGNQTEIKFISQDASIDNLTMVYDYEVHAATSFPVDDMTGYSILVSGMKMFIYNNAKQK